MGRLMLAGVSQKKVLACKCVLRLYRPCMARIISKPLVYTIIFFVIYPYSKNEYLHAKKAVYDARRVAEQVRLGKLLRREDNRSEVFKIVKRVCN